MLIGRRVVDPDYGFIERMGEDYVRVASCIILEGGMLVHNIPEGLRSFYEACGYRFCEVNSVGVVDGGNLEKV